MTEPHGLPATTLPATLNETTLADITAVQKPGYDRSRIQTGIVHFGVGGFHRAHQAMYIDRLMEQDRQASQWGICGVGVRPSDAGMRDALQAQDGLYTLLVKHADGSLSARVIGSIHRYLFAPDDPGAVVEVLAAPSTRIVSLTVTEGGYNIDQLSGAFLSDSPEIAADLKPGAEPSTVFGFIVAALRRRRDAGVAPFTVMSCDNIESNGDVARRAIHAFAVLTDPELAAWIEQHVTFPNSMVDRITPVTTDADRALVADRFGLQDSWPVVCEPYEQWVLEDSFTAGRPRFEDVGVQLTDDVRPYELIKLRLLNASHQAIAYFAALSGHELVDQAITDPLIRELVTRYMDYEAAPTLQPVPGIDLVAYQRTLVERFANPAVKDTVARLAADSSDRIPKWVLPVVSENLTADRSVDLAAAIVASWARYAEGVDDAGRPIQVMDRHVDALVAAAQQQAADPLSFLRNQELFGALADEPRFTLPYLRTLSTLHQSGSQAALAEALGR